MYRQSYFKTVFSFHPMDWRCSALVAVGIIHLAAALAQGDSELDRSRFLEEYQPHAAQIVNRYSNIFLAFTSTWDAKTTQQVQHVTGKFNRWNYLLKGKSKQVQKDTGKVLSESKERIECRNALYSFNLRQEHGEDYTLSDLKIHDAAHETEFCCLSVPYTNYLEKRTYLEMAQDPKTSFLQFADCVWQGKPMKVLECQYTIIHPGTHKPVEVITNYYFSPEDGWVCCGWGPGSSLKHGEHVEEIYFYEPEQGERLPKLKRTEKWLRNIENPRQTRRLGATDVTEFRRSPTPFPDSDFKLSAFGLPEPIGLPKPERPRTWIWLLVGAVGAGLMAIFFTWLKRRRATVTSTTA